MEVRYALAILDLLLEKQGMDTESQWIYDRMRLHQLMQAHPTWSPAHLAAVVGRSERWGRKWVKRLKAVETPTYTMYLSHSRAPKTRSRQTSEAIKDVIGERRETLSEHYHRPAGAALIRHMLAQDPTVQKQGAFVPTSTRTIAKILRERGYLQSPPQRQRMPLELVAPMEEWEMDFCEIRLPYGPFEFFLVVDRGTSRVVYLEGCEGYRADSALAAVERLFRWHGLPKRLRFDRDPRLVWSWTADSYPAPLLKFLYVLGVEPVICPPRRPDKKPYVERCVRTFKHEWLDRFSLDTLAACHEALAAFPHYHNHERLHLGRACHGRTPDEAFPQLPTLPALPTQVHPNAWLTTQHGRVFRRHIQANGTLHIDKQTYYVDPHLAQQAVLVHMDAQQRCLWVWHAGKPLPKSLPLKGLYAEEQSLADYLKILQEEAVSIASYRHLAWMQSSDSLLS
jgi:hypothetical protein